MPRLRQVIAQRMTESLRVSAQLTTVQEVDVTHIARLRARAKAEFERLCPDCSITLESFDLAYSSIK